MLMKWLQNNGPISVQTGLLPDKTSLKADLLAHFPVIIIDVHDDNLFKGFNCFKIVFLFYYFCFKTTL